MNFNSFHHQHSYSNKQNGIEHIENEKWMDALYAISTASIARYGVTAVPAERLHDPPLQDAMRKYRLEYPKVLGRTLGSVDLVEIYVLQALRSSCKQAD